MNYSPKMLMYASGFGVCVGGGVYLIKTNFFPDSCDITEGDCGDELAVKSTGSVKLPTLSGIKSAVSGLFSSEKTLVKPPEPETTKLVNYQEANSTMPSVSYIDNAVDGYVKPIKGLQDQTVPVSDDPNDEDSLEPSEVDHELSRPEELSDTGPISALDVSGDEVVSIEQKSKGDVDSEKEVSTSADAPVEPSLEPVPVVDLAPGSSPESALGSSPEIAPGTSPESALGSSPEIAPGTSPESALGSSPGTSLGSSPEPSESASTEPGSVGPDGKPDASQASI